MVLLRGVHGLIGSIVLFVISLLACKALGRRIGIRHRAALSMVV